LQPDSWEDLASAGTPKKPVEAATPAEAAAAAKPPESDGGVLEVDILQALESQPEGTRRAQIAYH
jgi:hypothetical protein